MAKKSDPFEPWPDWSEVEETSLRNSKKEVIVKVRCGCGFERLLPRTVLKSGKSKCCRACSNARRRARGWNKVRVPDAPLNVVLLAYKNHAKRRGYSFELTSEQFKELMVQNCFYCDAVPSNKAKSPNREIIFYNGVDRRDNTKGYALGNCVPCCKLCNRMKMDLSEEQMFNHMKAMLAKRSTNGQ